MALSMSEQEAPLSTKNGSIWSKTTQSTYQPLHCFILNTFLGLSELTAELSTPQSAFTGLTAAEQLWYC